MPETFKGWATTQDLPETFKIEWIVVQEPNKVDRSSGGIYVWASDIDAKPECYPFLLCPNSYFQGPRAYLLEYNVEGHEQAMEVIERIKKGEEIMGELSDEEESMDIFNSIEVHNLSAFFDEFKKEK